MSSSAEALELVRVLLVITELERGGAERVVVDLARHLNRAQFAPFVATLRDGGALTSELEDAGVPVEMLGAGRLVLPASLARLRKLARSADLVHAHLPAAGLWVRFALSVGASPITVYTEHNVASAYSPLATWLNCVSLRVPNAVVAVSEEVRRSWAARRCRKGLVRVIPNGVAMPTDPSSSSRRTSARQVLGIDNDVLVIGSVGNLFPRKGQRYLLDACAPLLSLTAANLVLIGEGPIRADLERAAAALGVRSRVIFTGARDDVPHLLSAFDVFVLPSLVEGLPLALLEAMGARLPSVATAVGGVPEVIQDGESGLLVPPRDTGALRRALERLAADPLLRRRLGERARDRIASRFDVAQMVGSYERLYLDLVSVRSSRHRARS